MPALTVRLKLATQDLHRAAERAGAMGALLAGRLALPRYMLLLRNLHALYEALESGVVSNSRSPPFAWDNLRRAHALAADLDHLHGPKWNRLALAPATQEYITRLRRLANRDPALLAAHAYVRYLGDLSGGQILRDVVRRAYALTGEAGTQFYAFSGDVAALKDSVRRDLDELPVGVTGADAIVEEARAAFALHVRLFEELDRAA